MTDDTSDTTDEELICEKHGIRKLTGYDGCPRCQQEAERAARERERMTRHAPRNVDDIASTASYRAW